MSNLPKKMNKYEEILSVLCETDEDISHAVLITAHDVGGENAEYDTTISAFRCNLEVAKKLAQAAAETLQKSIDEKYKGETIQ